MLTDSIINFVESSDELSELESSELEPAELNSSKLLPVRLADDNSPPWFTS